MAPIGWFYLDVNVPGACRWCGESSDKHIALPQYSDVSVACRFPDPDRCEAVVGRSFDEVEHCYEIATRFDEDAAIHVCDEHTEGRPNLGPTWFEEVTKARQALEALVAA